MWLLQHGDEALPDDVVDRVTGLMRVQPRDRSRTFSASSAGRCLREQELTYCGIQPGTPTDPQLQNIFNDGKWRHLRWQAMLLAAGILYDIEWTLRWPAKDAVGTMDGLGLVGSDHPNVMWRDEDFGMELKGVSTFVFQRIEKGDRDIKAEHLRQVHRYFILSGGIKLFVIIYEDKTTQRWLEWVVTPDPALLAEQERELDVLNNAIDQRRLHPMLSMCKQGVGQQWNDCKYGGRGGPCQRAGTWPGLK